METRPLFDSLLWRLAFGLALLLLVLIVVYSIAALASNLGVA
jgi:hypothetical protein